MNKVYCPLHYADVSGLGSGGEEFMAKLRDFKRQSLGCAGEFFFAFIIQFDNYKGFQNHHFNSFEQRLDVKAVQL